MRLQDPVGVTGAPRETLDAVRGALGDLDLAGVTLVLVTDRQGQRAEAVYGALLHWNQGSLVTVPAFGPRFGEEGAAALRGLVEWLTLRGLTNVKETVIPTSDLNRVLREPDEAEVRALLAAANPSDPNIYLV